MRIYNIYLDNCILYPFYYEKDSRNKKAIKFFNEISKFKKITLCISDFNFTELIKVSRNENTISEEKVNDIVNKIIRTKKIGGEYPIKIVECEGKIKNYKFVKKKKESWVDITDKIITGNE